MSGTDGLGLQGCQTFTLLKTTTTYTVSGTSQYATGAGIDSVTVFVPVVAPFNVNAGDNQEVCVGSTFNLVSSSSGGFGSNSWTIISG